MIVITDTEVYSDSGRLVHRIGTNTYFVRCMKFPDDTMTDFEEVDAIPQRTAVPSITEQIRAFIRSMTREMTEIADNDALDTIDLFDEWDGLIGQTVKAGRIVRTAEGLWRVRQEHTVQAHYPPSIHTASLYERIVKTIRALKVTPSHTSRLWRYSMGSTTLRTVCSTYVRGIQARH